MSLPLHDELQFLACPFVASESFHVEVLLSIDDFGRRRRNVLRSVGEGLSSIHVLLQVLGVNDWVDLDSRGELQLVGDGRNDLEDFVGAVEAGLELLLGVLRVGGSELFGREED